MSISSSPFFVFSLVLVLGCQGSTEPGKGTSQAPGWQDSSVAPTEVVSSEVSNPKMINKDFIIQSKRVGRFLLDKPWRATAASYGFDYTQGFGECIDACCNGGFHLFKKGNPDHVWLTVGAMPFDLEADESRYAKRKDVFFVTSDNCSGWYKGDHVFNFQLYDKAFQTIEGVGVGTSLAECERIFGTLDFQVGWIEEDANALFFMVDLYEGVGFILDAEDYKEGWEALSYREEKGPLKVSDFKSTTVIQRIVIGGR
jgi:hypothetical protein